MSYVDRQTLHHLHIARFVLEAETGFSIASGITDVAFDNLVVRDANQLPAIPGTSIAGVLRSEYAKRYRQSSSAEPLELATLFGDHLPCSEERETEESIKSRVEVSWGVVHDATNSPVEQLQIVDGDPLLEFLREDHPIVRDRVKISHRGTAADKFKFDVTTLPRGVRFSTEISLWSSEENPAEWHRLRSLIADGHLCLGSSVGTGMGVFKCIEMKYQSYDLSDKNSFQTFSELDASVSIASVPTWSVQESSSEALHVEEGYQENQHMTLTLNAEDFWRVGQGMSALRDAEHSPDLRPYHEPAVLWVDDRATLVHQSLVVPGSAIKGALRHRFEFHYARYLLSIPPQKPVEASGANDAISPNSAQALNRTDMKVIKMLSQDAGRYLFGSASDTSGKSETGHKARINVSEARPIDEDALELFHMTHTSIDRFTGGVRTGALYSEELIWKNGLMVELELHHDLFEPSASRCNDGEEHTKESDFPYLITALKLTLDDLQEGRLALGGGSAKGHGYFQGRLDSNTKKPVLWKLDLEGRCNEEVA